jgi:hypothetical protein
VGCLAGKYAHGIFPHSDILQSILQHLQKLFWKLNVLAPITSGDVAEYVTYGGKRIRNRARDTRRRVLALLLARRLAIARSVAASTYAVGGGRAGGFREDEVTQEPGNLNPVRYKPCMRDMRPKIIYATRRT